MENFFYATAVYADGSKATFEGQLWFLGGIRCEEGHKLLQHLKNKYASGEIVALHISYES